MAHVLGIDIGGTGIKAAPVDLSTGKLLADRIKIDTPRPALPPAMAAILNQPIRRILSRRGPRDQRLTSAFN